MRGSPTTDAIGPGELIADPVYIEYSTHLSHFPSQIGPLAATSRYDADPSSRRTFAPGDMSELGITRDIEHAGIQLS